eukprot:3868880-Pyramimonas_sp.AAC.1
MLCAVFVTLVISRSGPRGRERAAVCTAADKWCVRALTGGGRSVRTGHHRDGRGDVIRRSAYHDLAGLCPPR